MLCCNHNFTKVSAGIHKLSLPLCQALKKSSEVFSKNEPYIKSWPFPSSSSSSVRVFLSPFLHAFHNFLSFAVRLQVGPMYRIKSLHHLVLGRSWDLLHPWGIHSVTDCPFVVTSPCHVSCPYVFAFLYVPGNIWQTTLFPDPVCTVLEGDSYHNFLYLPLGCDKFLELSVAKRPGLTTICHYWECTFIKCFPLLSHWNIFILHDVV